MEEGIGTSNGMGFTPDGNCMYHTDTRARTIYLYDYDARTGELSNRRVFIRFDENDAGRPDGITVDSEGCVWVAFWDGWRASQFNPAGKELVQVSFPVAKVSCPAFGGSECDQMYVTTAGGNAPEQQGAEAGALFRFDPGVRGAADFRSMVRL